MVNVLQYTMVFVAFAFLLVGISPLAYNPLGPLFPLNIPEIQLFHIVSVVFAFMFFALARIFGKDKK